jgi:hypothetical protein
MRTLEAVYRRSRDCEAGQDFRPYNLEELKILVRRLERMGCPRAFTRSSASTPIARVSIGSSLN